MPVLAAAVFSSLLFGVGVPALTAVVVGNILGPLVLGIGVAFGTSVLQSLLTDKDAPRARRVARVNDREVRGTVKQATPPLRIVFGEVRVGGAIYFYKVVSPYLYLGLMHSFFPVSEYRRLFVGEQEVILDDDLAPLNAPFLDAGGTARIRLVTQDGSTVGQVTNPILSEIFGSGGTGDIDSDFRLPAVANTVFEFDYGADFDQFEALWGNVSIPDAQWVVRGTPVPDPREPTHILDFDPTDVDSLYAALGTWSYSNNAALIQAFWAMMPFGLNAGPNNIDWDKVAEAADFDDEPVPLKDGGFQKRHTIDGVVTLDEKPLTIMEAMLTANRGFVVPRNGLVTVSSSQPRSPKLTIVDDDILGSFTYRDAQPKRDRANIVNCTFIAPDRQYQDAKGPVLRRTDLITSDGEDLEQNLRLPFTSTHQRAQRIIKAFLAETRLGKQVSGAFSLRCLGVTEGDVVKIWSETFPDMNGLYSVEEWSLAEDFSGLVLALAEYDPDISRDWTASEDENDFALEVTDI